MSFDSRERECYGDCFVRMIGDGESKSCWGFGKLQSCDGPLGTGHAPSRMQAWSYACFALLAATYCTIINIQQLCIGVTFWSAVARASQRLKPLEVSFFRSRHVSIEYQERLRPVFTMMNAEHEFNTGYIGRDTALPLFDGFAS